jgi:hypothetical protein
VTCGCFAIVQRKHRFTPIQLGVKLTNTDRLPRLAWNRSGWSNDGGRRFIKLLFIGAARRRGLTVSSGVAVLGIEAAEMAAGRMAHVGSRRDRSAVRLS